MDAKPKQPVRFTAALLPWLVGAAALVLYGLTLNRWVTMNSVLSIAKATGWDWWSPNISAPLHYLITLPVRSLAGNTQALALNAFSAVCAALTLVLLARSVALLPHDRTRDQRQRERSDFSLLSVPASWLPPLFACLLCGLQLTFWENATAHTGEMLNLLMFAYVIRCLLEYRIEQKDAWLWKFAAVYGLAITNNWAMIGFLPFFAVAVVWIKGLEFFRVKFLAKFLGVGAAGLLFYLVLPLVEVSRGSSSSGFLELLRQEISFQRSVLTAVPKWIPILLSMVSILPVVSIGIRWPSSFGDMSAFSSVLTNVMFRVVHGIFLGFTVWSAFDPAFSPRKLGLGLPFMTFYYLGALGTAYCAGYFLLVCGHAPGKSWERPSLVVRLVNGLLVMAVWAGSVAVPILLVQRNWTAIQNNNGTALKTFTAKLAESLPNQPSIVISENPITLLLISAWETEQAQPVQHALVDARSLPYSIYHQNLARHYPTLWTDYVSGKGYYDPLNPLLIARVIEAAAQGKAVNYAHPAFGRHYFENYYLEPHGLVYQLKPYAADAVSSPKPAGELLKFNEIFWTQAANGFNSLPKANDRITDAEKVAAYYSTALDYWGVELQKAGLLSEALQRFKQAAELNPANPAARENLLANEKLTKKEEFTETTDKPVELSFGKYRTWHTLLTENGPFDEPHLDFALGQVYLDLNLIRQAAGQFGRAVQLAPKNLEYEMFLADTYMRGQDPDEALRLIADIHSKSAGKPIEVKFDTELRRLESIVYLNKKDFSKAEQLAKASIEKYPTEELPRETLTHLYILTERYTNALASAEAHLKVSPNNLSALLNKAAIHVLFKEYDKAIPPLDKLLSLKPGLIKAVQNRAIAHLNLNQLDAAERDYEELQKGMPFSSVSYYGLAEIAYRQKRTKDAIKNYELALKYLPPGNPDAAQFKARLKELRGN